MTIQTELIEEHGARPVSLHARPPLSVLLREGRRDISPELAERILQESNYVGQRKIDHRQVGVYAEMMRRGLWTVSDPIAFGRLADRLYLVNGQHRLQAVIAYGRAVECRIAIDECRSERELRELYFRFDTVMRRRSDRQVLNAVGLAAEKEVQRDIAAATYRALGVIANGFVKPQNHTIRGAALTKLRIVDLRLDACEPFWPAARLLQAALKRTHKDIRPRLLRATTFAVALMTMRYQPQKAEPFWRGAAEDDGLKALDVRKVFLRDLMTRDVSQGGSDQGVLAAAIAWNAWFEARPLKIIKIPENCALRIAGTPVGGRRP